MTISMGKLFHHYKNMPYKFVGIAKHSETQTEVVIYETRYENSGGKVWVRPKDMFFESVTIEGKTIPRFKEIPLQISQTTSIAQSDIQKIIPLIEKALGKWDPDWFYSRLNAQRTLHLLVASFEGKPVGFKLGYANDDSEFYSWLGGVDPDYRGLGVASSLMEAQHEWCRSSGFKRVQTKTQNKYREMFILNLKHGFDVIGCHQSKEGLKIIFEKSL